MFVRMCEWACVHMCDGVLQRGRLTAWLWTLHASFIPLTSDRVEALLVMMWLLLPIMPRCRPGRKTVRYILFVPHRLLMETSTLLLFMKRFNSVETLTDTLGTSFTKLFPSFMHDVITLSCQTWRYNHVYSFMFLGDGLCNTWYMLHPFKVFTDNPTRFCSSPSALQGALTELHSHPSYQPPQQQQLQLLHQNQTADKVSS